MSRAKAGEAERDSIQQQRIILFDSKKPDDEDARMNKDVEELVRMGYTLSLQGFMGDVNAIMIDPETGKITGSHDTRMEF